MNQLYLAGKMINKSGLMQMQNGNNYINITLLIENKVFNQAQNTYVDNNQEVDLVAFGDNALMINNYLQVGSGVALNAKVKSVTRQTNDGRDFRNTSVFVDKVFLLGGTQNQRQTNTQQQPAKQNAGNMYNQDYGMPSYIQEKNNKTQGYAQQQNNTTQNNQNLRQDLNSDDTLPF